jgi:hypothetical protein
LEKHASGSYSAVTGGAGSGAWEEASTVSGGYNSIAEAKYSWIAGGAHNITSAPAWFSAILGGELHEIVGHGTGLLRGCDRPCVELSDLIGSGRK